MEENFDELWDAEWSLLPEGKLLIKYSFDDDGYAVLITNFCDIYGEKISGEKVMEKFKYENPSVEMKTKIIMSKVKETLEYNLKPENKGDGMKIERHLGCPVLRLQFTVSEVMCRFDISTSILSSECMRNYVIAPTMLTMYLLTREDQPVRKDIRDLLNIDRSFPSTDTVLSYLHKKSEINFEDLQQPFLKSQKSMLEYINKSKSYLYSSASFGFKKMSDVPITIERDPPFMKEEDILKLFNSNVKSTGKSGQPEETKQLGETSDAQKTEIVLPSKRELDSEMSNTKDEDTEEEGTEPSGQTDEANTKTKKKKTFTI